MKQTSVPERRKFDITFKREAVLNWLHSGKSATVVGEELGINANLLRHKGLEFGEGEHIHEPRLESVVGANVADHVKPSILHPEPKTL